jgi:trehalose 6-phosphate phosphatase
MRHLLENWNLVAPRLRAAPAITLFLDFDGTLVRLAARPENVALDRTTRQLLLRLARHPRLSVCIISGRRRADLRKQIHAPGVRYLGLQGWETHAGQEPGSDHRRLIDAARRKLARRITETASLWIEDKGATLALHYRASSGAAVREARQSLQHVLEQFPGRLRLIEGDHVWELLPREVGGKGAAVRQQCRAFHRGALPVYAGNDATDEPAFRVLTGGVTIRVGPPRQSHAKFHLRSPAELRRFLKKLEEEVRRAVQH